MTINRHTKDQLLELWESPLMELASLAFKIKRSFSGDYIFYNRNFHIEPTNICAFNCRFCSFRKPATSAEAWSMTPKEIVECAKQRFSPEITEIHLVGGVHPSQTLDDYCNIISLLKREFPSVALKAFSAIEHIYMIEKAGISYKEGIEHLKAAGMDSITGGGAEIFDNDLRKKICPDKPNGEKWLRFHKEIHKAGIKSNATMLYGHIESVENRIDHLLSIRDLQDETSGFISFIPLKFRSCDNPMSEIGECSVIEDLRTIAISRIALDNVPHIKAYYPMFGKSLSELALQFGADDLDGTPIESTKIYSMAGVKDKSLTVEDVKKIITDASLQPIERDTFYNPINNKVI